MALLTVGKAEASPMPRAGGSSEVTFVARSTPGQSFLRAHFAIRSAFPYEHKAPTNPKAPKGQWGRRCEVKVAPRVFRNKLELICTGNCSDLVFVTLDVKIHETDRKGARLRDAGGRLTRPITRSARIRLV